MHTKMSCGVCLKNICMIDNALPEEKRAAQKQNLCSGLFACP